MRKLSTREAAGIGPRALKEPGSVEWCWQTLDSFKRAYAVIGADRAIIAGDVRVVERLRDDLLAHRAWEKVPPEGAYGTPDALFMAEVGVPLAGLNRDVSTAQGRAEKATPALTHEEAGALGGRGHRKASAIGTSFSRGSNNADYLTARIARDHPAILQRMKAGEFPSVRQAGIAAGIVRVPTGLDQLRKAWGKATADERAAFLQEFGAK